MSLLLITSIIVRCVALVWSVVLGWRWRDTRLGFLAALFGLLALDPILHARSAEPAPEPAVLGLLVSLAALLAIVVISRRAPAPFYQRITSLYQDLVDQINDVLFALDHRGRFTYISPVIEQRYGYSPAEVIGKTFTDFIHPDDQADALARYYHALSGKQEPYEVRVLTKQGTTRHVCTYSRLIVEQDRPAGLQGVITDITAQKKAEHGQRRLATILEKSTDFVLMADAQGHTVHLNQAGRRLMGFDIDEDLSSMTLSEYYPEAEGTLVLEDILPTVQTEGLWMGETVFLNRDGQTIPISQVILRHKTPSGETEFFSTIARDLTAQKRADDALKQLTAELEARNAEVERFTYRVSHDLKTPLVTIKGFLGLLVQDATEGNLEKMHADAAYISSAAEKMYRLLDALLTLSRIGRIANPPEDIPLTELAHEAVAFWHEHITAYRVEVLIDPAMPTVYGDRARLLQVYENLIDNALKFMGPQPKPRLTLGARYDNDEMVCYVQDNGIGIAPEFQEQVFGLFVRLNADTEETGLGLALTKRIVEVHGGRIWIESDGAGQGATVCFTLRVQPQPVAS